MKNFTINTLRENRSAAWEKAKTFLDTHRTENGTLSAEDAATYDRMEAEVIALGKETEPTALFKSVLNISMGQIFCLLMILAGIAMIIYALKTKPVTYPKTSKSKGNSNARKRKG